MNIEPCQSIHRLGIDGYERPKKTYTDTLQTANAIEKKLEGYLEIPEDDVDNLAEGSFIRYIKWDTKNSKERFVTGGVLLRVNPQYLLLKGKDNGTFSAQRYAFDGKGKKIYSTRFFKLLNNEEKLKMKLFEMQKKANGIIEDLENTIEKQAQEIDELKNIIRKYRKKIKE